MPQRFAVSHSTAKVVPVVAEGLRAIVDWDLDRPDPIGYLDLNRNRSREES